MRRLKPHEQKLLKKVDFLWQREGNLRELQILRRRPHERDRQPLTQVHDRRSAKVLAGGKRCTQRVLGAKREDEREEIV